MYSELTDTIFAEDVKESIFYASCLTLYRLHLLTSNNIMPQIMRRAKWHVLPLVRAIICGKNISRFNSKQIEDSSNQIIDIISHHNDEVIKVFNQAKSIIESIGNITDDRLKRQAILSEMMDKL